MIITIYFWRNTYSFSASPLFFVFFHSRGLRKLAKFLTELLTRQKEKKSVEVDFFCSFRVLLFLCVARVVGISHDCFIYKVYTHTGFFLSIVGLVWIFCLPKIKKKLFLCTVRLACNCHTCAVYFTCARKLARHKLGRLPVL